MNTVLLRCKWIALRFFTSILDFTKFEQFWWRNMFKENGIILVIWHHHLKSPFNNKSVYKIFDRVLASRRGSESDVLMNWLYLRLKFTSPWFNYSKFKRLGQCCEDDRSTISLILLCCPDGKRNWNIFLALFSNLAFLFFFLFTIFRFFGTQGLLLLNPKLPESPPIVFFGN